MSGKQMKKLRRQAEAASVGTPWKAGGLQSTRDRDGNKKGAKVVLSTTSGRGIYKALKKEHHDGSR